MEAITALDCIFDTFWDDDGEYVLAEEAFWRTPLDQRFMYFYDIMKRKNCLPALKRGPAKCQVMMKELKKLGDEALSQKLFARAVKWYTKSVSVALHQSDELASVFGNRSTALYFLERFMDGLVDSNRASLGTYGNFPDDLKPKLTEERNACYKMILHRTKQSSVVRNCAFTRSSNPERKKKTWEIDCEMTDMNTEDCFPLPNSFIHKNMNVKYDPKFGRHIVATKEIKPGEKLGVEKPFASVLSLKYRYFYCANCLVRSMSLIPCPTCALFMFCGEKCRDNALERYHRVECQIIYYALYFNIEDEMWLAMRILMIATKQGKELNALMEHSTFKNPMEINRKYIPSKFDPEDYLNLHHLEDNAKCSPFEESCKFGFTAALLLHMLKKSEFFGEKKKSNEKGSSHVSTDLSSEEQYAGMLLLKFLYVIKHNAFEIIETLWDEQYVNAMNALSIGSGIYVFHSYFNHSCDPNAAKTIPRNKIISYSIQLIKAGEKISLSYGPIYGDTPRRDRSQFLHASYKFDCKCDACKYDWPQVGYSDATTITRLKPAAKKNFNLLKLKELMNKTRGLRKTPAPLFDKNKYNSLCESMETYHKNVKKPCEEYYKCQHKLRDIYAVQADHYLHS